MRKDLRTLDRVIYENMFVANDIISKAFLLGTRDNPHNTKVSVANTLRGGDRDIVIHYEPESGFYKAYRGNHYIHSGKYEETLDWLLYHVIPIDGKVTITEVNST